ncbi:MAG: hypothetical protein KAR20_25335 [Candidatus Heimdallarchaeota archaeon]|nr:hypothetical protein [Candidatus Heimdallarchaeota archaeon]
MGYSFLMHPSLVPMYGGGEQFYLDDSNNYTAYFPFYADTRLSIIMNVNDTVQISINDENLFTGTYYEVDIDPNMDIVMTLQSFSPVKCRFTLRQETPVFMAVFSVGCFLLGILSICMNWYYFKKKSGN